MLSRAAKVSVSWVGTINRMVLPLLPLWPHLKSLDTETALLVRLSHLSPAYHCLTTWHLYHGIGLFPSRLANCSNLGLCKSFLFQLQHPQYSLLPWSICSICALLHWLSVSYFLHGLFSTKNAAIQTSTAEPNHSSPDYYLNTRPFPSSVATKISHSEANTTTTLVDWRLVSVLPFWPPIVVLFASPQPFLFRCSALFLDQGNFLSDFALSLLFLVWAKVYIEHKYKHMLGRVEVGSWYRETTTRRLTLQLVWYTGKIWSDGSCVGFKFQSVCVHK